MNYKPEQLRKFFAVTEGVASKFIADENKLPSQRELLQLLDSVMNSLHIALLANNASKYATAVHQIAFAAGMLQQYITPVVAVTVQENKPCECEDCAEQLPEWSVYTSKEKECNWIRVGPAEAINKYWESLVTGNFATKKVVKAATRKQAAIKALSL